MRRSGLFTLLFFAACASSVEHQATDGGSNVTPLGSPCTLDADCSGQGAVKERVCSNAAICIVACHRDSDCAEDQQCDTGKSYKCVAKTPSTLGNSCAADSDCTGGRKNTGIVCSTNSHKCISACHRDDDCPMGQSCSANACLGVSGSNLGGGKAPSGKGLWIWYWGYIGKTPAQAAQEAKKDGVGYVLIKSGENGNFWSDRLNAASVAEFTSRGMLVYAWPYMKPWGGVAAEDAAARAASVPGVSGVILDVEIEFGGGGHGVEATALCQGIRRKAPGIFLGYSSFGWVGYHTDFPYREFDKDCGDAFLPQVYWSDRQVTWEFGYYQAKQMLDAAGLQAPVWMAQSNDDGINGGPPPTVDGLNAFFDQAGPYSSLWEFPEASRIAKLNQLPLLHFGN